ncbi:XRE family transcriptional regulator [Micromonospora sp. KC606]|nr:XRE family transcriptional regulator [Micromonospora sp. KC606]
MPTASLDIRAELHDGADDALDVERARAEAWVSAFHLAEERNRRRTRGRDSQADGPGPRRAEGPEHGAVSGSLVRGYGCRRRGAWSRKARPAAPRRRLFAVVDDQRVPGRGVSASL